MNTKKIIWLLLAFAVCAARPAVCQDINQSVQGNDSETGIDASADDAQDSPEEPAGAPVIEKDDSKAKKATRLHTLGVSIGTAFADPLVIATVHGTFSPVQHLFLELGFDAGFVSKDKEVSAYYSLYPFAHIGYFKPFWEERGDWYFGGWYIGAGGGYMTGRYTISGVQVPVGVFAVDLITGFNVVDVFDISYTVRSDFRSVNHKLSMGYTYRFQGEGY